MPALETEREGRVPCQTSPETGTLFTFKRAKGKGNRTAGSVQLCLMSRMSMPVSNMVWCCGHS